MKLEELTDKHAVHIPTQEEWDKFAIILNKAGYKWRSGDKYTSGDWTYKELMCIRVKIGDRSNLKYFQREDYTIINVSVFLNTNKIYELWD